MGVRRVIGMVRSGWIGSGLGRSNLRLGYLVLEEELVILMSERIPT